MDAEVLKLVITGVVSPTVALIAKYIIDKKSKEPGLTGNVEVDLKNHPFFERMKCLRTHIQYTFELPNKGKQEVFKDILINKFNIAIDEYWSMIKDIDTQKKTLSDTELYNIVVDHIREGLKKHEAYYLGSSFTADEKRCLEIVLQKFNKWHAPRIDNVLQTIQSVCSSRFYSGVVTKGSVVLDVLQGSYVDIINDAELTLNEINGDMRGLMFKGIKL
jgi:hypothetical protein